VSWQVTGVRHDEFARANPVTVEGHKDADDVGKYMHPAAFGRPRTELIGYQAPLEHGLGRSGITTPEPRVVDRSADQ
jgi:hypothetical protein